MLIPRCLFQRDALGRLSLYETADLCRDCLPPAVLLPHKPHPSLPSQALDLISLEKEACVHIPIHLCCLNTALYVSCFFYPPLPTPVNLLSLSGMKKNKNKKKSPPPTKRTKTWGASEEERPLPLKFRNKKKWLVLLSLLFPDVTLWSVSNAWWQGFLSSFPS